MAKNERTSKQVASKAAKILRNPEGDQGAEKRRGVGTHSGTGPLEGR